MQGIGLISIAGMVGVGKTTLARALAGRFGSVLLVEEPYDRNPFLVRQYQGDSRAALASQIWFLLSRVEQLQIEAVRRHSTVVTDYVFEKDRLFARLTLSPEDYAVYDKLAIRFEPLIARPVVVIYLTDTVERCLQRIAHRGRPYEQDLTVSWLQRLHEAYESLFANWESSPMIRLDCSQYDARQEETPVFLEKEITESINCKR